MYSMYMYSKVYLGYHVGSSSRFIYTLVTIQMILTRCMYFSYVHLHYSKVIMWVVQVDISIISGNRIMR